MAEKTFEIKQKSVLIIGAGIAGLEVAKQAASFGIKAYLLEKEAFLGGVAAKLDELYPEETPSAHDLPSIVNDLLRTGQVEILTNANLLEVQGEAGNYKVKIKQAKSPVDAENTQEVHLVKIEDDGMPLEAICHPSKEKEIELEAGAIVVATGLISYDVDRLTAYGHNKFENVLTTLEFDRKIRAGKINPKRIVIMHCIGSRDEKHLPFCSRICCFLGLKEAELAKKVNPETEVYICYIDMRSYGELENLYGDLRKNYGVKFIQGKPSEVVRRDGKLVVRVEDIQLGELVELETDCVVLSHGFRPDEETFKKLGVPIDSPCFPRPYIQDSDTTPRGIFVCGAAAFPKLVLETLSEARDVALGVIRLLLKK